MTRSHGNRDTTFTMVSELGWRRNVDAMGQTPRRSLKLPRENSTKPQRSASAAAVLVHLPDVGNQFNAESRVGRGQLKRLLSRDGASSRDVLICEQHDQQEASREVPPESRAASLNTPENDCSDPSTFSWEVSHTPLSVSAESCLLPPSLPCVGFNTDETW